MGFQEAVHAKALDLTRLSVDMTTEAGSGHPSSAASLAHLVTILLYGHMRHDPSDPDHPRADRLILSEGHACPIIYAAAADLGIAIGKDGRRRPMTREDAMRLREIDSEVDGHPNPAEGFPFFPAATGSLGQGLSVAAGMGLAARLDGADQRFYCLIGDGESREGQVWEAVDFIVEWGLTSVCPIFNCNHFAQSDPVSEQQSPEALSAKLAAFGFDVTVIDGHSPAEIRLALTDHAAHARDARAKPFAIVARTVKGWGFLSPEQGNIHGKAVSGDDAQAARRALDETAQRIGAAWSDGELAIPPVPARPAQRDGHVDEFPSFREAMRRLGQESALEKGQMATRKAYGYALQTLGHIRADVVALDGDVKNSTYAEHFARDPALADRFFECRIAEQNMIAAAAGLAAGGKTPFVSTFGKFFARAYDQLEMALIGRLPLRLAGSHEGANIAADGPSQMALSDVAFFRSYASALDERGGPVMYVLNPADAVSAYALVIAMARHEGAAYMRTLRPDVPFLYEESTPFQLGGHQVLRRGRDILIAAAGYMVHEARGAVERLEARGISATLADLYSIPFDRDAVAALAREHGGRVLTVEDNYGASLGSEVADALAERGGDFTVRQMFVRRIPKSGRSTEDVLRYLGLSAEHIVEAATELAAAGQVRPA